MAPEISVIVGVDSAGSEDDLELLASDLRKQDVRTQLIVVHDRHVNPRIPSGALAVPVPESAAGSLRPRGLAASAGRAVMFVRPGDRLLSGALRPALDALDADPDCGFVFGRSRAVGEEPDRNAESLRGRDVHVDHYVQLLRGNFIGPSCAVLIRRSVLTEVVMSDPAVSRGSDYALYLRVTRNNPIRFLPAVLAESARTSDEDETGQLKVLGGERRHAAAEGRALEAFRRGEDRLVTAAAVRMGNEIRAKGRRALPRAGRLIALLAGHPRALPALLGHELLPWLGRRSRRIQSVAELVERRERTGTSDGRGIDEAVRHTVPPGTLLLVLSRPDPGLALTHARISYMRPGEWSAEAPNGDYLLVPATSFWELRNSSGIEADLAGHWERVWEDPTCRIYRRRRTDPRRPASRVLVSGYFSFPEGHATAGDLLVRDQVCRWLQEANKDYDVAHARPFPGGVDWRTVDPQLYSHVIFACGPFSPDLKSWELLERFPEAKSIGVNLSMLAGLDEWNPFDVLIERDSSRTARPDVAFATSEPKVPVVGVCLREHAPGTRSANAAVHRLLESVAAATVPIDTRLDAKAGGGSSTGQRTAAEVESLIARMDALVTTRLHGLVLGLKNGVPVVAVDPGNEGYKIRRQAELVGWPIVFAADEVTDDALREALEFCTTQEARDLALRCGERARQSGAEVRALLLAEL